MSNKWAKKILTDEELLQIIDNDEDLDAFLPEIDNNADTDWESDDEGEPFGTQLLLDSKKRLDFVDEPIETNAIDPDRAQIGEEPECEPEPEEPATVDEEVERQWSKIEKSTEIPSYIEPAINWEEIHFIDCQNPLDIFLKLLGNTVEDITYQCNLYATQKGKNLNMKKEEFLAFIGINFLMGYHVLPSIPNYWSTQDDLSVALVSETMPRNRFQAILSLLHINDNSLLSKDNTDRLYKVRPFLEGLNSQFINYCGGQVMSVDESMIKFKGRSSLKQYNPMKPIKRGYKLWCYSDMNGFIKKFDVYQGKNQKIDDKYKGFNLGERIVLHLTQEDWGKNKIIYFDNFYTTVTLLEKLKAEKTLACGTIRSNRKNLPSKMKEDKKLERGEYDFRISNTGISYFKWKDNRIVSIASNFHGTGATKVKRKQRDGKSIEIDAPQVIKDYNESMGGVDLHDQMRQCYGLDRRSKKWWHRIFWGCIEITFINSYVIAKKVLDEAPKNILDFRKDLTRSLCYLSPYRTSTKRKSVATVGPPSKKKAVRL